jgi:hypothetical protein
MSKRPETIKTLSLNQTIVFKVKTSQTLAKLMEITETDPSAASYLNKKLMERLKAFKMLMVARTLTKVRFLATTSPLQATT